MAFSPSSCVDRTTKPKPRLFPFSSFFTCARETVPKGSKRAFNSDSVVSFGRFFTFKRYPSPPPKGPLPEPFPLLPSPFFPLPPFALPSVPLLSLDFPSLPLPFGDCFSFFFSSLFFLLLGL